MKDKHLRPETTKLSPQHNSVMQRNLWQLKRLRTHTLTCTRADCLSSIKVWGFCVSEVINPKVKDAVNRYSVCCNVADTAAWYLTRNEIPMFTGRWKCGGRWCKNFAVRLIREKLWEEKQIGLSCGCSRRTIKFTRVRQEICNYPPSRSLERSSLYKFPRWPLVRSSRQSFSSLNLHWCSVSCDSTQVEQGQTISCLLQHRLVNLCIILSPVDQSINSLLFQKC